MHFPLPYSNSINLVNVLAMRPLPSLSLNSLSLPITVIKGKCILFGKKYVLFYEQILSSGLEGKELSCDNTLQQSIG